MNELLTRLQTHIAAHAMILFTLIAACAEAALACFAYSGQVTPLESLAAHFIVVTVLAAAYFHEIKAPGEKNSGDFGLHLVVLLAVAVSGVLGASGGLALLLVIRRLPDQTGFVDEWYDRLSCVVEVDQDAHLYQAIRNNRAHGDRGVAIERFETLILNGTLADKQALLSLIALNYHPEYRPVLFHALRDAEPTVRVQAAALFTKLQEEAKQTFKKLMSDRGLKEYLPGNGKEEADRHKAASRLLEVIEGGFLDKAEIVSAQHRIDELIGEASGAPLPDGDALKILARSRHKGDLSGIELDRLQHMAVNGDREAEGIYAELLLADDRREQLRNFMTLLTGRGARMEAKGSKS